MSLRRFGQKLRELRKNEGLTQAELARQVPVSPELISIWERAYQHRERRWKPDRPSVLRLVEIFADQLQPEEAQSWIVSVGYKLGQTELQKIFPDYLAQPTTPSTPIPDFQANLKRLELLSEQHLYYSCFISYSSKDEAFAQRLHADLQDNGVRCWFAPEDMKIGDKIRPTIDQSIRVHDKLLLILSEHSLHSLWVESEVEKAFEEERKRNQTVLFPVRLDGAVMETDLAWAAEIRRTRHIGDFSRWKDHDAYQQAFERLLRDLKAEG
jgi:transcriptional regulator with XRE-family HTH domain